MRVRGTRVRKALRAYGEGEGAEDVVRIELPPGSYTPTFSRAPVPPLVGRAVEPAVLVMLFDAVGEGAALAATAVCEALVGQLARFPGLRVLGPGTSPIGEARHIGRQLGARYVLQGSVFGTGDVLRLSARVTDAESGEFVWAVAETMAQEPQQVWALVDGWVAEVAGELGDYAGALLPRSAQADDPDAARLETASRLAFYTYIAQGTNATLRDAREALALAREAGSGSPAVLAMHANTLAVTAAYGLSEDPVADLVEAEATAREALAADPRNAHAHLDLGTVALARGQWEVAIQRAHEGARLGAGHPTMLATAGTLLALAGAWAEGVQVMQQALRLNPSHPGYMHGLLALDRILVGDDAAALAEASLIHAPDAYRGPFYRALALAGLGYRHQAHHESAEPGPDPAGLQPFHLPPTPFHLLPPACGCQPARAGQHRAVGPVRVLRRAWPGLPVAHLRHPRGWNYFQGNIFGVPVSGHAEANSLFAFGPAEGSSDLLSGGDFGIEASLAGTVMLVIALGVAFAAYRRAETARQESAGAALTTA